MKLEIENHLTEKQIIQAVVDITDLTPLVQAHLSSCGTCHTAKAQFEQTLQELGNQAVASVPVPKHRFPIVLEKSSQPTRWFFQWRTSLGMAISALLLITIIWGGSLFQLIPGQNTMGPVLGILEAEALIQDVNMLAENALPPVYLELSKELEAESDFDDLFIEYIIPLVEDESLSLKPGKKGLVTC